MPLGLPDTELRLRGGQFQVPRLNRAHRIAPIDLLTVSIWEPHRRNQSALAWSRNVEHGQHCDGYENQRDQVRGHSLPANRLCVWHLSGRFSRRSR